MTVGYRANFCFGGDEDMRDKKKVNFTLTENALDFIQEALARYNSAKIAKGINKKKDIKYSILNLNSGIELLLKQRLYSENWAYTVDNIDKNINKDIFLLGNFNSVRSEKAISRLENLCEVKLSKSDKQILDELRKKRNQIEHFNINDSMEALQSNILMALSFAIRFISNNLKHLKLSNSGNKILAEIKATSKEIEELESARIELISQQAKKDGTNLDTLFICPKCLKKLYYFIDGENSECLYCNHRASSEELAYSYLSNELGISEYSCAKDGDEWPLYICPFCGWETLVRMINGDYLCFECGEYFHEDKIKFCLRCNTPNIEDEMVGEICKNCIDDIICNDIF